MSSGVEAFVLERIAAAPVLREPFEHCIVDGVFPEDFYESIIDQWPEEASWRPLSESGRVSSGSYEQRQVVLMNRDGFGRLDGARRAFWEREVGAWLLGGSFRTSLLAKFGMKGEGSSGDALIVSDRTRYAIGPHTDAPHRLVSLLFYLPEDSTFSRFGTAFYTPLDPAFRCAGGPHHPFERFRRVRTVEFLPNRLVLFPKTDRCFHGVETVDLPGIDRRLLIYNVRSSGSGS